MTQGQQPEALRLALSIDLMDTFTNYQQEELDKAAAELRRQHARIAELEAQLDAIGAGGVEPLRPRQCLHSISEPSAWVSVKDRLPEPGMAVLLDIGKKTPIRAMWAAKHTVEAHDEADPGWCDYDETTGMYYCPEGWYEWNQHEEVHWAVSEKPRAWMPLPSPSSADEGGSNG